MITDDYQFLSSSTVANVAGGASNQVLAGTGLGLLHAYDGVTGRDDGGLPQGHRRLAVRPGSGQRRRPRGCHHPRGLPVRVGRRRRQACQSEWPSFRHDQQGSGNYDADGTPPGRAGRRSSLEPLGGDRYRLKFRSPGDDGLCGTADSYVAEVDGARRGPGRPGRRRRDLHQGDHAARRARAGGRPSRRRGDNDGAPGVLERPACGRAAAAAGPGAGGGRGGSSRRTQPGAVKRKAKPAADAEAQGPPRRPQLCPRRRVRAHASVARTSAWSGGPTCGVGKKVLKDASRPLSQALLRPAPAAQPRAPGQGLAAAARRPPGAAEQALPRLRAALAANAAPLATRRGNGQRALP